MTRNWHDLSPEIPVEGNDIQASESKWGKVSLSEEYERKQALIILNYMGLQETQALQSGSKMLWRNFLPLENNYTGYLFLKRGLK